MTNTVEFKTWTGIKSRCSPKARPQDRATYYDRGIRVADEWMGQDGFMKFYEHVGPRPGKEYSLDRIDPDKGYEPGNVRWATMDTQIKNRRKFCSIERFTDLELMAEILRRGMNVEGFYVEA
jgi:hypothetical protein